MKKKFPKIFNWELWPYDLFYFPISIYWFYYGLKARAFWFFTPVNPSLIFAGFEGGSKMEVYNQLPNWCCPTSLLINTTENILDVINKMETANLQFPVVAKPDAGMQGVLFRILENETELGYYHKTVNEAYILQTFVHGANEYSVFHVRYPDSKKGFVTGLVVKEYLHVIGDGKSSLATLINAHPNPSFDRLATQKKHEHRWNDIIAKDEQYFLSLSGNHCNGAKFVNLNHQIDDNLCQVFDKISIEAGQFYYGRYDLKCTSLEDLKQGKNINILEYNGTGASITHVLDCNMSYINALKEVVKHWKYLFEIGKINNKKGVPYWSFKAGNKFMQTTKQNFKRMFALHKTMN